MASIKAIIIYTELKSVYHLFNASVKELLYIWSYSLKRGKEKMMKCKICGGNTDKIFSTLVLYKYNVDYYRCTRCDFMQTEEPYWLNEAYLSSMNLSDTGVMLRSERMSKITTTLILLLSKVKGIFIDYAGGLGMFTRTMRDIGFDYYWTDPYTENVVARGFEGSLDKKYDGLTTFESFEHFNDPVLEAGKMFGLSNLLIFTTDLMPVNTDLKSWWYIAPEHGQHIAFYSKKTFEVIAEKFNANYYNAGNVHILCKNKLSMGAKLVLSLPFLKHFLYIGYFFISPFIKSRAISDMNSFYIKESAACNTLKQKENAY